MSARSVSIYANDPTDPEGDRLVAGIEKFSQHLIMKGDIHALIHEGRFFSTGLSDVALSGGASLEILIQAPIGAPLHVRFQGSMGADASTSFFEGTTFSAAGAAITPVNRNRRSTNAAGGTWTSGPTITADGTELFSGVIPGGSGGNAPGAQAAGFQEWILGSGVNYLARITNLTGQAQVANLEIDFYDTGLTAYA